MGGEFSDAAMDMQLYCNTNERSDFFSNAFERHGRACDVFIASAFFTDSATVLRLIENQCRVFLIVRLGRPTSADALKKILSNPKVQVRFFTDKSFHPKIYVFGEQAASIGSSNFTNGGLSSNQEVNIVLSADHPLFVEVQDTFSSYWDQAKVLDAETLERYGTLNYQYIDTFRKEYEFENKILETIGKVTCGNIVRGGERHKDTRSSLYVDGYRREYQAFLASYAIIRDLYEKSGKRKLPEARIPLRIEIDQFYNWIAEKQVWGKDPNSFPIRHGDDLTRHIETNIMAYINTGWPYLDEIADERYPLIYRVLGTEELILAASGGDIIEALMVVHAFHDIKRFIHGGEAVWRKAFLEKNDLEKIKATLIYLLHNGEDEYVTRMAHCLFNEKYRLWKFGRSCVQETLGWVNVNNIPICNQRTLKAIRWLGFKG